MFSRKRVFIGIVAFLVIASGVLIAIRPPWKSGGKNDPEVVDTLAMIEQLTPEIATLSENLRQNPNNPELLFARANAYFNYGNMKYAVIDYEKAYRLDSTNAPIALGFSDCLFELNNAEGAIAVLEDYLLHDNQNVDILINLGTDYFLLPKPQYQKAIDYLNAALKIDIQNADAYFYKGLIYKESGDLEKAISNFQTAVETDPDYYDAYMQLGLLYTEKKNPLALKYFDNAIAIDSSSTEAQYAKAKFYQDAGQIREAITYYRGMIVKNAQDADAIYNLATIYFGIDSIDQAYRFYDLAIKQAPAKAISYYGKALCAEELKNKEEAISLYTQALNLDPDLQDAEERLNKLNGE